MPWSRSSRAFSSRLFPMAPGSRTATSRSSSRARHPASRVGGLTCALFERRHRPVLFTRDWHPRETKHFKEFGGAWPAHCIQGTKGARFHPDLQLPAGSLILSKGMDPEQDSYSAFQAFTDRGRDLESTLLELDVDELFICGLATDYCVRATTLDGLRRGLATRVLRDAVPGVDL